MTFSSLLQVTEVRAQLSEGLDFDLTAAALTLLIFRESVVDLLLCMRSSSCSMSQFQPSFSCHTDGLTLDSSILWYTEEFMTDQVTARCANHHLPTTSLTV